MPPPAVPHTSAPSTPPLTRKSASSPMASSSSRVPSFSKGVTAAAKTPRRSLMNQESLRHVGVLEVQRNVSIPRRAGGALARSNVQHSRIRSAGRAGQGAILTGMRDLDLDSSDGGESADRSYEESAWLSNRPLHIRACSARVIASAHAGG